MKNLRIVKYLSFICLFAPLGLFSEDQFDRRIDSGTVDVNAASDLTGVSGLLSKLDLGSTNSATPVIVNILQNITFAATADTANQQLWSGFIKKEDGSFDHWEMRHTVIAIIDGKILTFSNNTSPYASAMYAGTSAAATASSITFKPDSEGGTGRIVFSNNFAKGDGDSGGWGGAAYINGYSISTFINTDFTNNKAGGDNANYGYGGAMDIAGKVVISNSTFTSNTANNNAVAFYRAYGGAINIGGYSTANVSISNSAFTNNSTYGDGGAIHSAGLYFTLNNTDFTGNKASNHASNISGGGGALFIDRNATITGGKFNSNTAANGGAIRYTALGGSSSYLLQIDGSEFKSNNAWGDSASGVINGGGAIYSSGKATIKNATFELNTADGSSADGGAVLIYTSELSASAPTLIENSSFTSNRSFHGKGGAIAVLQADEDSHEINLTICDTVFTDNRAGEGGAIYLNGAGVLNFEVTEGKHLSSTGNTGSDSGFLYVENPSTGNLDINFNIAQNSSYTIGVKGVTKDGLASYSFDGIINKTGKGKLIVNSDAMHMLGMTNIVEGELVVNNIWGCEYWSTTHGNQYSYMYVKSGATLSGEGGINDVTIESGGILSPGDGAAGTLEFGDLTLDGGAILKIENGDLLNVWGNLIIGDTSLDKILIDLYNFSGETGNYKIFGYNTLSGVLGTDLNEYFDFNGKFTGRIFDDELGGIWMNGTVVPEPSTYAAILGLLALTFAIYRKRK